MFTLSTLFHGPSSRKQKKRTKPERFFIAESAKVLRRSKTATKTKQNSWTALRSLLRFYESDDIPLSSITSHSIRQYEQWLWARGVSRNTSAEYMRSLRALYNKVSGRGQRKAPFSDVITTPQKAIHRAISIRDMTRLLQLTDLSQKQLLSRDLFLFSFYCQGMPFIDIAHLRWDQIRGDTLCYERHKTGVQVMVRLEKPAKQIIRQYGQRDSPYVFPILHLLHCSHEDYQRMLSRHNYHLKTLGRQLGIVESVTSYVARHTWATYAFNESNDMNIVSTAIGHADTKVTKNYITLLPNGKIARLNRKLIHKLKTCED